ncbi:DUF1800 domain-containing protein [Tabrizicola sp. DMG-N-6]|uniref:DUF1800 domain-containing protein n=2 Tax=Szabonella alba TaxID=2804194 RepID=A0A8K0V5M3_9RHOB|nr:DUF1800 domain-containing protein [Szabonella alba]
MARIWPVPGMAEVLPILQHAQAGRRERRMTGAPSETYETAVRLSRQVARDAARATIARALDAPCGFRERLVAFWSDHFTVKARNPPEAVLPEAMVTDAIRPHLSGKFADLLIAATLHPAMLVYLDQVASIGPGSPFGRRRKRGLNENLAREVVELHTMGVGAGYGQDDVRQMAELLTGLDATAAEGFVFRPNRAEPGPETVLGRRYDGEGLEPVHAVLRDLAARPETADHLSRKLAVHFVADEPDPALVAAMVQAWRDSDGTLRAVYGAMLHHPAAWGAEMRKARQPFDFIIAACRALGLDGLRLASLPDRPVQRQLIAPMALMGQRWRGPGGPDGWAEDARAWITPQGMAARIGWAMESPQRLIRDLPDPRDLAQRSLGADAGEALLWAVARAETRREGVGLLFSSPAFNRR